MLVFNFSETRESASFHLAAGDIQYIGQVVNLRNKSRNAVVHWKGVSFFGWYEMMEKFSVYLIRPLPVHTYLYTTKASFVGIYPLR